MFKEANMPTILVIFGATGDLSRKKLLPALFDLHKRNLLPDMTRIVAVSRRAWDTAAYRAFAEDVVREAKGEKGVGDEVLAAFLELVEYQSGDFTAPETYRLLSEKLIEIERGFGVCANKLFYLSVSPAHYEPICKELADSGLTIPCSSETGWTRVLIEKPFGKDIATARKLDAMLGLLFKEEQIFRIDHYLGKETVQDILTFRFSNLIFEPIWNNKYIEKVSIVLYEDIDIAGRGAFYDGIGALRDVGQNHILQMLALVAMERPERFAADAIRRRRTEVLHALAPFRREDVEKRVIRAQYEGYENEEGVVKNSQTETYFKMCAFVDNERWRGVPFELESGKALGEKKTEITIHFKPLAQCFCTKREGHIPHANKLVFRIQPDEGISVLFWAKKPGVLLDIEPKTLSFSYGDKRELFVDAYEKILFDAIAGDQTLFTSTEEVAAAWEFITPIIQEWGHTPLLRYKKGTMGPGDGDVC